MLKINISNTFKKDLKKFKNSPSIIAELDKVLKMLIDEKKLPEKYKDHPLSGNWKNSRDCHLKPDVLLIYRVDKKIKLLILERIGSHAELFK